MLSKFAFIYFKCLQDSIFLIFEIYLNVPARLYIWKNVKNFSIFLQAYFLGHVSSQAVLEFHQLWWQQRYSEAKPSRGGIVKPSPDSTIVLAEEG